MLLTMQMVCLLPSLLLSLLLARSVEGQACSADGKCDSHERCPVWKEEGECIRSKAYMTKHCPVSCAQQDLVKPSRDDCEDALTRCSIWADLGECDNNREMKKYCAKSCGTCENAVGTEGLCRDTHENCKFWASIGECANNPNYMLKSCTKSCGTCEKAAEGQDKKVETAERKLTTDTSDDEEMIEASQGFGELQVATGVERLNTLEVIKKSIQYMATEEVQSLTGSFKSACRNKHELCSYWAAMGECEANKAYMKLNCAPACNSCDLIDINNRCPPLPEDTEPALRPGALNKMFERIIATAPGNITDSAERQRLASLPEYTVQVLSRPSEEPVSEISLEVDKELPPWVVTFDNFLSGEECDQLIALGQEEGYKRSEDVGKINLDGTVDGVQSVGRTSENAWCSTRQGCRTKELPQTLHNRIAKVLDIPSENSEDFQILRYEIGQFYKVHHDYIPNQRDRQCGPRILTFFIYLSDLPENGAGGTDFPKLGLTVQPKKGSAVLWPSVYNADPMNVDKRMDHQALAVEAGTKFAANAWIHMNDYLGPQDRGCN